LGPASPLLVNEEVVKAIENFNPKRVVEKGSHGMV